MNIQETDVWQENIYLIGDNDPVQGGENGVDNLPHKQLASRTLFLKNKVDKLEAKVDGLSSTIDKLQQPEDTLGLQKQIDVLKEQIAEIVKNGGQTNGGTKTPLPLLILTYQPIILTMMPLNRGQ